MFITMYAVLLVCSISVFSEAAFVDTIKKCSSKDSECLRTNFSDVFKRIGGSGVSELGIPPFDPLEIKDQSISILNLIDLKVQNGKVTGVKNCNVDKFLLQLDERKGTIEFTCDLIKIEGQYELDASSSIFKDVLGSESVHGNGVGNIKIEKLHLKLDIPNQVQKRDGDIYLKCDFSHAVYEYDVLEKLSLYADNLSIGGKESSKEIIKFVNENWKLILNSFGKPVVEKALNIAFGIVSKFFDYVPAKYYISDNLSSYS